MRIIDDGNRKGFPFSGEVPPGFYSLNVQIKDISKMIARVIDRMTRSARVSLKSY